MIIYKVGSIEVVAYHFHIYIYIKYFVLFFKSGMKFFCGLFIILFWLGKMGLESYSNATFFQTKKKKNPIDPIQYAIRR